MEEDSSSFAVTLADITNTWSPIDNTIDRTIQDDDDNEKENLPPGTVPGGLTVFYEPVDVPVLPPSHNASFDWDDELHVLSADDVSSIISSYWGDESDIGERTFLSPTTERALIQQRNLV